MSKYIGPIQIFIFITLLIQIYLYYVIYQISLHTLCENATDYHGSPTKKLMLANTVLVVGNILLLVPTQIYNGHYKITFGLDSAIDENILYTTFVRNQRVILRKYNILFGITWLYVLMYIIWTLLLYSTNIFPQCLFDNKKHIYYKCIVLLIITNVSYGVINVSTLYFWCQIVRKYNHAINLKKKYCWLANYYKNCEKLYKIIGSLTITVLHILAIFTFIFDKLYNSNILFQTIFWVGCICDAFNILIMLYKNSIYATIEYVIFTIICTLNNMCLAVVLLVRMDGYSTFGIISLIFSNIYVIGCLLWVMFYLVKVLYKALFTKSQVVLEQSADQPMYVNQDNVYQNMNSSLVEVLISTSEESTASA